MIHSVLTATVAFLSAAPVLLNDRGLIEQALDEPTHIVLENVALSEALHSITEQTGVRIEMPPQALRLVPHGGDTVIGKVEIAGITLRQGLTEMFTPLGMTFTVGEDVVEIVPKEALRCLARPPTWEELDTLAEVSALQPGLDPAGLESLRPRLQFQVPVPGAWELLSRAIANVGAGPGDEVLTVACRQLGWGWCLAGQQIVVKPLQEQIIQRLKQPISLRMNSRPLIDVLNAIGRAVNVDMRVEPAALAALPLPVQRTFSLNVSGQPAEQALETIAAYTALGYYIEPDGVIFYNSLAGQGARPQPSGAEAPRPAGGDPYVAKLSIPLPDGASMEWLIRRSELPDDLREMRQRDIQRMIDQLRQSSTGG